GHMTTFTSIVTTNPDFGGFEFYVEAGQQFDDSAYEEAYGVSVPSAVVEEMNAKAAQLKDGEWLNVSHEA
uniref:anti-CRIPSR AcrIF7 n=1 Tax=Pseudomonas aeruginosa TaxID=287 RepID=UPI001643FAA3|nr:Chain A, anti-CRIPSR AcrIF7 [Pseudomonas aeruginosa]